MEKSVLFLKRILGDFAVTARLSRERVAVGVPGEPVEAEGKTLFPFAFEKEGKLTFTAEGEENCALLSVSAELSFTTGTPRYFAADRALELTLHLPATDGVLAVTHDNPWWMLTSRFEKVAELPLRTQGVLLRREEAYLFLLPLTGENFRCELPGGRLTLSVGASACNRLSGGMLCIAQSKDPYEAIRLAYAFARARGAIRVALREERAYPEAFEGLGYCTWNTCYQNITAEKVYAKLTEFREKGIPVQWIILDDGWSCVREEKLWDFEADPGKFPDGLRACIRRIKEEFGIRRVGVWHTLNAYWKGIHPESPLCLSEGQNLDHLPGGAVIPSADEERAFAFFDHWHTFLENCGVDFVKVDNQSSFSSITEGTAPTATLCRSVHRALERSVAKHFGGAIINCMGMDMENVLERPATAVSRNSDDFYPDRKGSFYKHLVQNAWNALWHSRLYVCDYDMWWSEHESARQSGILRAISGGPLYVSDAQDGSNAGNIRPCILPDGRVPRMDGPALPTRDLLFTDCAAEHRLVKVWNRAGENFALALFAFEGAQTERVSLLDIPGIEPEREYLVFERTGRMARRMKGSDAMRVTLPAGRCAAYSVLPIVNGTVLWGDPELYFPGADPERLPTPVETLLQGNF